MRFEFSKVNHSKYKVKFLIKYFPKLSYNTYCFVAL
jgi:hypothetical protein